MFFRNFLPGALTSWRALSPMDRINEVFKVPFSMSSTFMVGYGFSAYLDSLEQPQRASAEKSSVEPESDVLLFRL